LAVGCWLSIAVFLTSLALLVACQICHYGGIFPASVQGFSLMTICAISYDTKLLGFVFHPIVKAERSRRADIAPRDLLATKSRCGVYLSRGICSLSRHAASRQLASVQEPLP